LREIRPAPFVSADDLSLTGEDPGSAIAVSNPLRTEEGFLRTTLTPGLLRTIARNQAGGVRSTALFEVGAVFRQADPVEERRKVAFALAGPSSEGWPGDGRPFDLSDAKGVLESVMTELGVADWDLGDPPAGPFHPGRSAWVMVAGERAGVLGELHPGTADALDLGGRIALAELELAALLTGIAKEFAFRDVPRYPPVRRDLAFMLPEDVPAGAVRASLQEAGGDLLGAAALFDVYRGDAIPSGTRSLAFSLDIRSPDRTLTDEEADVVVQRIVARLAADFGARLRAG
jgi:phenylalanyl-tRNA synthetase beta chain